MLKRLLQCLREYKRATILTPIFMVGEVTCECIIPLLTAKLVNGIQSRVRDGADRTITAWQLLAMALLSLGLRCGCPAVFCATASGGLCPEPAARPLLPGAGLFLCKYRSILRPHRW